MSHTIIFIQLTFKCDECDLMVTFIKVIELYSLFLLWVCNNTYH